MNQIQHSRFNWAAITLAGAAAVLAFQASAQSLGAGASFEGRPSMAGAQAGQGAMAGPPTGGIGLQGSEGSRMNLRPPSGLAPAPDMPQGNMANPPASVVDTSAEVRAADLKAPKPAKDSAIVKDQRTPSDKVRRSAQRTIEGAKYGVSPADTR